MIGPLRLRPFAVLLAACSLLSCESRVSANAGEAPHSKTCVQFLAMPAVSSAGASPQPAVEWSANDDLDTLLLAADTAQWSRGVIIEVQAGVRSVSADDSVKSAQMRYATIGRITPEHTNQRSLGNDLRVVAVFRPSALDALAGTKGDERVLQLRARAQGPDSTRCGAEIRLLIAM